MHDPDSCCINEPAAWNHKHTLRTCAQTHVFHLSQIPEGKAGNQRFSKLEGIRGCYLGPSVTDEGTQFRLGKWLVWRYGDKVFLIKNFLLLWINTCSLVPSPWRGVGDSGSWKIFLLLVQEGSSSVLLTLTSELNLGKSRGEPDLTRKRQNRQEALFDCWRHT